MSPGLLRPATPDVTDLREPRGDGEVGMLLEDVQRISPARQQADPSGMRGIRGCAWNILGRGGLAPS